MEINEIITSYKNINNCHKMNVEENVGHKIKYSIIQFISSSKTANPTYI